MAQTSDRAKPPPSDPALEKRVEDLEQTVAAQQDQIAALQGVVEQQTNDITDLEQSVTDLDNRLAALETGTPPEQPPEQPPDGGGEPPVHVEGQPDIIMDGKTLNELCAAGGTVDLPSGTFWGVAALSLPTTVIGHQTTLTAQGLTEIGGKAMFETTANLTLQGLVVTGSEVPDGNGCVCRPEGQSTLTMIDCEVYGCQMGLLTSTNLKTVLDNCYFHDSGNNDGMSHEIYVQSQSIEIHNSRIFAGPQATHAVKSRSPLTMITSSHLKGSPSADGNVSGSVLDIPDGGDAIIQDTILENQPQASNRVMLTYAVESDRQGVKTVTLRNVTVKDTTGSGGSIVTGRGGNLVIDNCHYTGNQPPPLDGWTNVQGQFQPATRR